MMFCSFFHLHSQENDTLSYAEQLALLEAELDSLSIFNLIDSLFELDPTSRSELNLRFGFTSSVTSAGRDYNLDQQGYNSGIGYYHRSGAYGDLSGYWSSDISPNYNPTILSVGYLGDLSRKFSYSFDYEHWFFNPKDTSLNSLTNSVGTSLSYDFKIGYVNLDYSYLWGAESSHRFIGNLTGNLQLGSWWVFSSVSFYPTFTILYGNSTITQQRITRQQLTDAQIRRLQGLINNNGQDLSEVRMRINQAFANGRLTNEQWSRFTALSFALEQGLLTEEQIEEYEEAIRRGVYEQTSYVQDNEFGLLNYAFSFPISLSTNRLSFLLSYSYSLPISSSQEEEVLDIGPIGYFGFSVSYRIPFNTK